MRTGHATTLGGLFLTARHSAALVRTVVARRRSGHDPARPAVSLGTLRREDVAEEGLTTWDDPSGSHLAEATDLLRAIALGRAELRQCTASRRDASHKDSGGPIPGSGPSIRSYPRLSLA